MFINSKKVTKYFEYFKYLEKANLNIFLKILSTYLWLYLFFYKVITNNK